MRNKKGKFITFEGGEGVGKTAQIELLLEKLKTLKLKVKLTREPGGTSFGELIRNLLKSHPDFKNIDPLAEAFLMFAIRKDHYEKIIKPFLDEGYIVICDRFYDSTIVYQGMLKNIPYESIMTLKNLTLGDFEPDLTFILDLDPKIASLRLENRELNLLDAYDSMDIEKHNIIRTGFKKIAKIFSYRTKIINANKSPQKIALKIFELTKTLLNDKEM